MSYRRALNFFTGNLTKQNLLTRFSRQTQTTCRIQFCG